MMRAGVVALPLVIALSVSIASAQGPVPRFTSFAEAQPVIREFSGSGFEGTTIDNASDWDRWIRAHDKQIRRRIDRGLEDSISNLILYGTSYTQAPRLETWSAATDSSGHLSRVAVRRINDLLLALQHVKSPGFRSPGERLVFVRRFLETQKPDSNTWAAYLSDNLLRFVKEQQLYEQQLATSREAGNPTDILATRESLYANRGLSVDTSLMPNYALADTLRVLRQRGVLWANSIHAIAVIGPGLDFADKRQGFDYYPEQMLQPFAMLDAVITNGVGPQNLSVTTFDLNPEVNSHVRSLRAAAREGRDYTLQLPLNKDVHWTDGALDYWATFGRSTGTTIKPLMPPGPLSTELRLRAIGISASSLKTLQAPIDLDIVCQTPSKASAGYDLVVATNILVYYNPFEQALAMQNINQMLAPHGIFLANNVLPHPPEPAAADSVGLDFLGRRYVHYNNEHTFGDDVVVYQKQ